MFTSWAGVVSAEWVSRNVADLPDAIDARLRALPSGLRDHIERSRGVSQELAIRHNVDARLADMGTAAHDLARALGRGGLLSEAESLNLSVGIVERHEPILLHGPIAARWLESDDDDIAQAVLESVAWHTTGRPGMGDVAKVVFLADKLDPRKVARFPYLEEVAVKSKDSLDLAILEYLDKTIEYFLGNGNLVHTASIEFRNELLIRTSE